jgi:hypothetical protein
MEQRSIRIDTLGDLAAHGYGLNATCERCRHRSDLDIAALILRLGEGFCYIGRILDGRLVCTSCGVTDVSVQVHNMNSSRSLFAG